MKAKIEISGIPGNIECRVDGVPFPEMKRVVFDSSYPDESPTLNVEVNALHPFSIMVDEAKITVNIMAYPGFTLRKEQLGNVAHYSVILETQPEQP